LGPNAQRAQAYVLQQAVSWLNDEVDDTKMLLKTTKILKILKNTQNTPNAVVTHIHTYTGDAGHPHIQTTHTHAKRAKWRDLNSNINSTKI
jgi:hypothetical protein